MARLAAFLMSSAILAAAPACLFRGQPADYAEVARAARVADARGDDDVALREDEAAIVREADLGQMIRIALARNPDLLEGEANVRLAISEAAAAGGLPDLELKYEQWGVPLRRPYALGDADTLMIGVRQSFPALGTRAARERAGLAEARVAAHELRALELDLMQAVARMYFEYVVADRAYAIHLEQVELTERILELTKSSFRFGRASEQDVLRVGVALASLHRDLAGIQQRKRSAIALLNRLMARATDAAIGPAPDTEPAALELEVDRLVQIALDRRPELQAADEEVTRTVAELDVAEGEARWPMVMVGADYMFMPMEEETHAYGAMVSINLPWLNPRHRHEVRAAQQASRASTHAAESMRLMVQQEVVDAVARYEAALEAHRVSSEELVPVAIQSFEAAESVFATGGGGALGLLDALRTLLDVRLTDIRVHAELELAIADLERATGDQVTSAAVTEDVQP